MWKCQRRTTKVEFVFVSFLFVFLSVVPVETNHLQNKHRKIMLQWFLSIMLTKSPLIHLTKSELLHRAGLRECEKPNKSF